MATSGTIFAVCQLPSPLAGTVDIVLLSAKNDSAATRLMVRADSSLALAIEPIGQAPRLHEFQRVQTSGSGKVVVDFAWTDSTASMRINGQELLLGVPDQLPTLLLETKGAPPKSPSSIFPGLGRGGAKDEAEALFLGSVADLDRIILEEDWYSALRGAAILRQLLLDGLLHRANARLRVSFSFRTNEYSSEPPDASYHARWINLDPTRMATVRTETLDLDDFLSARCLVLRGATATVKDVIKACANSKGGVHFGPPKPGGESTVASFDEVISILGVQASTKSLTGLFRITLNAVAPLVCGIDV